MRVLKQSHMLFRFRNASIQLVHNYFLKTLEKIISRELCVLCWVKKRRNTMMERIKCGPKSGMKYRKDKTEKSGNLLKSHREDKNFKII